jgi:hypothetical protein
MLDFWDDSLQTSPLQVRLHIAFNRSMTMGFKRLLLSTTWVVEYVVPLHAHTNDGETIQATYQELRICTMHRGRC